MCNYQIWISPSHDIMVELWCLVDVPELVVNPLSQSNGFSLHLLLFFVVVWDVHWLVRVGHHPLNNQDEKYWMTRARIKEDVMTRP